MADDFGPPPGVQAQQIIVTPPLGQYSRSQPDISTDKIEIGNSNSSIVQGAEAVLIDSTARSVDFDNKLEERKLHLEELRFKLEERKAVHDMKMEMRKEDFAEREQIKQERLINVGNDHWLKTYWRPMMGWIYACICVCDFILFPVLWNMLQVYNHQAALTPWGPLTSQGGGLFHIAFGAIVGVSSWSRGQERLTSFTPSPGSSYGSSSTGLPGALPR